MKKLSKKALAGIFAAGLMTVIVSISAFAATTFPGRPYNLVAGEISEPLSYPADENYMYFNTRPTAGEAGVYLTVVGPGVYLREEHFPFQVSRSPLKVDTTIGKGGHYTVYLTGSSTGSAGVLSAWTSAN